MHLKMILFSDEVDHGQSM